MKHTFLIILLCAIIGNILPSKSSRKRIPSRFSLLKLQKKYKDKVRKLEEDSTDILESGYNGNSTFEGEVKIKKFHNYKSDTTNKKISFSVFFYFIRGVIADKIKIPLKITHKSRIRILTDDQVTSECTIKDKYKDLPSQDSGVNVDYDCEASLDSVNDIEKVSVDDSKYLDLDGAKLSFDEVLNKEDDTKAFDITNSPSYTILGVLNNSTAEFKENSFIINGDPLYDDNDKTINGQEFQMKFINYTNNNGKYEIYKCRGTNRTSFFCEGAIQTKLKDMPKAESNDTEVYLKININESKNIDQFVGTNSSSINTHPDPKKSSGGLSGGAIAGIVIAGVVVLAGATTAAILLGRSKPPLDQTSNMVISSTKIV